MLRWNDSPPGSNQLDTSGFPSAGHSSPEESPALGMPSYLTPLIGRDDERRQLARLLGEDRRTIVVITGVGGIGKTRLAVQVANDLHRSFRHGTRFLPFASVPPGANIDAAFAWQLGLRDTPHQSHRESIQQRLKFRDILLVVDNVEHLTGIGDLLAYILGNCASVRILVTSRVELDMYGEVTFAVQPLPAPPAPHPGAVDPLDIDQVRRSPAVRLFVDRVRAVQPDFDITATNAADTLAICEHLGGVPLALELTASQMAGMTPAEVLHNLPLGYSTALHPSSHQLRHQVSLRDTVRASYDLLSPDSQTAFRALSYMRGRWSLEDVLPLLTPVMPEMQAIDVFDDLTARSLLQPHQAEVDELRFVINPVLRRFGEELMVANNERDVIAARHADRMVAIAIEAAPHLTGPDQRRWLARLGALHEDLRLAHAWLMRHERPLDALRLGTALWRYAYTRGQFQDARAWLRHSLAQVSDHDALRCRALNGAGLLANVSGDLEEAQEAHEQALVLATRTDQHAEIALAHIGLADVAISAHGDVDAALHHLDIARAACERVGEPRGIASILTNRGNIEWQQRHLDAAITAHEEARVLYQQAGDTRGMAWSDASTGRIAAQQQQNDEAIQRLNRSLDLYEAVGDLSGCAEIMEAIAKVAFALGMVGTSSMLAGAATSLRESIDSSLKHPDLDEFDTLLNGLEQASGHDHPTAFDRGRGLRLDEAMSLTRSVRPPYPAGTDEGEYRTRAHERFGVTPREHQVLLLVCDGLTDQQIADRLGIGLRTVHTHINQLMEKLGGESRVAVATAALRARIIPAR